ncbi:MAG: hypothetical protein HRU24_13780 [Gammaproteobacteria bacterium]|nr:hypothetical protein [Gammaproteobacteria bacterium]
MSIESLHQNNLMTERFYGIFDPLNQSTDHIARCACCIDVLPHCYYELPRPEQLPGLVNKDPARIHKKSFFIRCDFCGISGLACKKDWQAVIEWNKSPLSKKPPYQQFPIFGLSNLNKADAKEKLINIRLDLEQRKKQKIAQKERLYNDHYERLKAFLAWAIYAQTVVKLSPDQTTNPLSDL